MKIATMENLRDLADEIKRRCEDTDVVLDDEPEAKPAPPPYMDARERKGAAAKLIEPIHEPTPDFDMEDDLEVCLLSWTMRTNTAGKTSEAPQETARRQFRQLEVTRDFVEANWRLEAGPDSSYRDEDTTRLEVQESGEDNEALIQSLFDALPED